MGLFIVFGVNVGNLGRVFGRKEAMDKWVGEMNKKLTSHPSSTRIIDWYGHTGNFVIESSGTDSLELANELTSVLETTCAALTYDEAVAFVSAAEKAASPAPLGGKRWTNGIAFAVKGPPCQSVPKPTSHATFFQISERAVGAWKEDQLTQNGTLDREKRGGGWGAVSDDVSRAVGGVWTARSLRTVIGTLEKARQHTGQR